MTILEKVKDERFLTTAHEIRFENALAEQQLIRGVISKRESAFLYALTAMETADREEFFNPLACYPDIEMAVSFYHRGRLSERDAVIFALAVNLYNGYDLFDSFEWEGASTPYHFICKLKDDSRLVGEAMKIFSNGYRRA